MSEWNAANAMELRRLLDEKERDLEQAWTRIEELESENAELRSENERLSLRRELHV